MIQVIGQMIFGGRSELNPRVTFGKPLGISDGSIRPIESLRAQLISQARDILAQHRAAD
jgi:hypothetical protein